MNIVVAFKRVWGKDLFYPVSEDAHIITKITGRPTILKAQLKICLEYGWTVTLYQENSSIDDYL